MPGAGIKTRKNYFFVYEVSKTKITREENKFLIIKAVQFKILEEFLINFPR